MIMFGLILKYYLYGTTQDPVQVALLGSFNTLMKTVSINPSSAAAAWPRADILPLAQHDVKSQFGGGTLEAFVCTLNTSQFEAAFDGDGNAHDDGGAK
jgi:hypothetical protein